MRWAWFALALMAGCGEYGVSEPEGAPMEALDSGWVIRGTEPANILLTNGSFAVWINTATLQFIGKPMRIFDGRLAAVSVNSPIPEVALMAGENRWSFDLRSGELVSFAKVGSRDQTARVILDPDRPVIAFDVTGGPGPMSQTEAWEGRGTLAIPREGDGEPLFKFRLEKSRLLGVFAESDKDSLPASYAEVRSASEAFHANFWKTDFEIDGPAEDQLAIRTMLYYLRRGATPKLPPFGASNAKYRGARFWDAEAWMLPVLAVVDPEIARAATRWRIDNLGEYVPWEAAVGGQDVTPKEFGNALHVAGWVAWWTNRAKLLGLATGADEKGVLDVVFTQFYKAASDSERGMEIKGVESPDEGRLKDNDLVTNLLAKRAARLAADHGIADGEDLEWFNSIVIPKAADGLPAAYDNDLLKGYQQAAALLALYPLDEEFGEGIAEKMFDRYAGLTSEVGPAMSESIHATIAARLGRDEAYQRWRKSWQTYTDDAMMFHERRNKEDAYFMTGAAGCLQTVIYGFSGVHLKKEGIQDVASKSLGNGYQVAFRPNLPAKWKRLTLRNVFLGPHRATVHITHSGVTIE
ncbi:MAG: hypothetical protein ABIV13_00525 [Fimbriimonadales bacterium]